MMILGYRSNDAVISICQNNKAKSIAISEIDKNAEDALGYKAGELKNQPLTKILPPRIAEMLVEYVEFEGDAHDVGQVLSKVQSFSVVGKSGKEIAYHMKVVRTESSGELSMFKLVLQDKMGIRKNEAVRKAIQEHLKGLESLDAYFAIPDAVSLRKYIDAMGHYNNKGDMNSSFAVMQLDHFNELFSQYGRDTVQAILKHIVRVCRQSVRPDDVLGVVDDKRFGVLLMDTNAETARMAINRLRWQIAANPFHLPDKTTVSLSCSISFGQVGGKIPVRELLDACCNTLNALGSGVVNALVETQEKTPALASNS